MIFKIVEGRGDNFNWWNEWVYFCSEEKLLHVNILGEIGIEFLSINFRRNVLDGNWF